MLRDPIRENTIAMMFGVALCITAIFAIVPSLGARQQPAKVRLSTDNNWLIFDHESGGRYIIRTSAVIGFNEPFGDSGLRNIIFAGSHTIRTDISIKEFRNIVKQGGGTMKVIE